MDERYHMDKIGQMVKLISKLHWHKLQLQKVVLLTMERVLTQFVNSFYNEHKIKILLLIVTFTPLS
jgi:hypothetical protein